MTSGFRVRSVLSAAYDLVLGAAAGFSLGSFAWLAADRSGGDGSPPFWPLAVAGVIGGIVLVRWARSRRGRGRWVHVLWAPVLLFVVMMAAIVVALRNFT